uniref:BPTI/Kunitz inhibitor domain-containing protein n=1 Tax=Podarcis muralis TaxID=64176 RepID=A0A670IG83_PODMU
MPRYYYNPSQKRCLRFIYGGCGGNSNRFKTKKACEKACGKISPVAAHMSVGHNCAQREQVHTIHSKHLFNAHLNETGPCRAYSEFFYYNSTLSSCKKFVYGGCKGNDNRFYTRLECKMVCGTLSKPGEQRGSVLQEWDWLGKRTGGGVSIICPAGHGLLCASSRQESPSCPLTVSLSCPQQTPPQHLIESFFDIVPCLHDSSS